jgi:signal transduction histidine kinase
LIGETSVPGGVERDQLDSASELALVSFAARLLLSQLDRRLLAERGLESFLDFARGRAGGVYLLDAEGERLRVVSAAGAETAGAEALVTIQADDPPWREVLASRLPQRRPLEIGSRPPAPARGEGAPGRECLCVPLLGGANRVAGAVTIDRDASDRLEEGRLQSLIVLQSILAIGLEQAAARERLLEAHEELESLYAAKSKTIDHLSHELKTPLAVLGASVALLERASVRQDDARSSAVLERMARSIARLLELQEEACDIAAAAPGATAQTQEIELSRWIPEVLASIAPLHRHRGVRVEVELEPVPPMEVAEPLLRKALIGLVRNAIEATADGGWTRISTSRRPHAVVLEVADSGRGFDDATRRQLFHGFVHAGDTRDYQSLRPYDFGAGGRGLDLLRTRHFADRQGLGIEVESEPGEGSRFRLVFPSAS